MSAPAFDFLDPELSGRPYEAYAALRREAPVYRDPRTGFVLLTRYDDVRRVLLDPETFSSERWQADAKKQVFPARQQRMRKLYEEKGWLPAPSLAGYDDAAPPRDPRGLHQGLPRSPHQAARPVRGAHRARARRRVRTSEERASSCARSRAAASSSMTGADGRPKQDIGGSRPGPTRGSSASA